MREDPLNIYENIYLVVVKPKSKWKDTTEGFKTTIILMTDESESLVVFGDSKVSPIKFKPFEIPDGIDDVLFSNGSNEYRSYLIMKRSCK